VTKSRSRPRSDTISSSTVKLAAAAARDPAGFSPEAIDRATDAALKRLKTDHVDLLQLHNIRMEQVYDDALWKTLEKLKSSGKSVTTASRSAPRSAGFTKE